VIGCGSPLWAPVVELTAPPSGISVIWAIVIILRPRFLTRRNETCLISAGNDNSLRVWDLSKLVCKAIVSSPHSSFVTCCSVLSSAAAVVGSGGESGSGGGSGGGGGYDAPAESEGMLVTGSADGRLRVWDLATLALVGELVGHGAGTPGYLEVHCCKAFVASVKTTAAEGFPSTGQKRCLALSGGADRTLKLWDLGTFTCLKSLKGHALGVLGCDVFCNGTMALSASADHTIKVWTLGTCECVHTFTGAHSDRVTCVAASATGPLALSGSRYGSLQVMSVAAVVAKAGGAPPLPAFLLLKKLLGDGGKCGGRAMGRVYSCSIFRQDTRALSASADGNVRVWDFELKPGPRDAPTQFQCLYVLSDGHSKSVFTALAFAADTRIVSGSQDRSLKVHCHRQRKDYHYDTRSYISLTDQFRTSSSFSPMTFLFILFQIWHLPYHDDEKTLLGWGAGGGAADEASSSSSSSSRGRGCNRGRSKSQGRGGLRETSRSRSASRERRKYLASSASASSSLLASIKAHIGYPLSFSKSAKEEPTFPVLLTPRSLEPQDDTLPPRPPVAVTMQRTFSDKGADAAVQAPTTADLHLVDFAFRPSLYAAPPNYFAKVRAEEASAPSHSGSSGSSSGAGKRDIKSGEMGSGTEARTAAKTAGPHDHRRGSELAAVPLRVPLRRSLSTNSVAGGKSRVRAGPTGTRSRRLAAITGLRRQILAEWVGRRVAVGDRLAVAAARRCLERWKLPNVDKPFPHHLGPLRCAVATKPLLAVLDHDVHVVIASPGGGGSGGGSYQVSSSRDFTKNPVACLAAVLKERWNFCKSSGRARLGDFPLINFGQVCMWSLARKYK